MDVDLGVFARAWAVETRRFAWLLGAGTSAAAGVPTAAQVLDDVLLRLYADAFGVVRQSLDTTDPSVMSRVRNYYDNANGIPSLQSPGAYSAALALAMPDAEVRRQYLRRLLSGKTPSFGQRVLGAAVASGVVDLIATTNFDDLIERSVTDAQGARGTQPARMLTVAALGSTVRATTAVADEAWPLLTKLHGDFLESDLKNLDTELQQQDATLRQVIADCSRRFGLVVAGYSGRDDSVMDMLETATAIKGAWPAGIWWLTRNPGGLSGRVATFMESASANGVRPYVVAAENFDEAMAVLANQIDFDPCIRGYVEGFRTRSRVTQAPIPVQERAPFPVLRLNALPVLAAPAQALRVSAPAGVTAAMFSEQLRSAHWRGAAVLGPGEVLALGSASQLQAAVGSAESASVVDIAPLEIDAPAHWRALAAEALTRSLTRCLPAKPQIRQNGNRLVLLPPDAKDAESLREARKRVATAYEDPLCGTLSKQYGLNIDGQKRKFAEGVRLNLEHRVGVLWLTFVPFTWVEATAEMVQAARAGLSDRPLDPASPWNAQRWARRRRNEAWAAMIDAWAQALAPHKPVTSLPALAPRVMDLPDALGGAFEIGSLTAFSREAQ